MKKIAIIMAASILAALLSGCADKPSKIERHKSKIDFFHMVENKAKSSPKLDKAINFDTIPWFTDFLLV